ncbi:MAG: enoyl-CoA hydratase-related protein [Kineosporiaceae bacterium]
MTVHVRRRGACLEVVLDRPEKRNALTRDMYTAMTRALRDAADPAIAAVLVTSEGPAFTAGNDLDDFLDADLGPDSPVLEFLDALTTTDAVVVAAVPGMAVGVGATMLLHCDHVVAAPDASLRFAFVPVGLVPEAASTLLLPTVIGPVRARTVLLSGDPIDAPRALEWGLVNAVVPADGLTGAARAFADRVAAQPREALRATKRLLRSETATVAARMAEETAEFRRRLASSEFRTAAERLLARRSH